MQVPTPLCLECLIPPAFSDSPGSHDPVRIQLFEPGIGHENPLALDGDPHVLLVTPQRCLGVAHAKARKEADRIER